MPGNGKTSSTGLQRGKIKRRPDLFMVLTWVASATAVLTLLWILESIITPAWPAIQKTGVSFFTSTVWDVNRDRYGALPFLIGTTVSSLIALCIALPLGVFIALFLSENFLPLGVRQFIRFIVELLAAIPSVVYGLWGIAVVIPLAQQFGGYLSDSLGLFIPLFKGPASGNSMLTASLVLALMVLPTITAISRTALIAVPSNLREGSYAVGATRWETIFRILIPTAAPGIVAATILAFGRAMGETMAVAMLIGNSPRLSMSLLSPAGTLAGLLANQFGEAQGLQISALMYAALVLVLLTLLVNLAGEAVLRRAEKSTAGIR
jgi:phosphate transport system permease protein